MSLNFPGVRSLARVVVVLTVLNGPIKNLVTSQSVLRSFLTSNKQTRHSGRHQVYDRTEEQEETYESPMPFSFYIVVVLTVTMGPSSSLSSASWLYDHDEGEGRDGSCFPTQDSENRSYTCKGENITSIPDNMPPNITQL